MTNIGHWRIKDFLPSSFEDPETTSGIQKITACCSKNRNIAKQINLKGTKTILATTEVDQSIVDRSARSHGTFAEAAVFNGI